MAIPMTEPEPDLKWNIARNFVVGAAAVVVVVGFIATLPVSGPIAAAAVTGASIGALALGGAVVISNCMQDAKSGQARDPIEMFNQTFFGAVTGAVSGAFGGASGAMLGSVTAQIGLIVLGNAYSAAGETIIENTMFGEEITMKELLLNAALGASTGGVGDNLHRAGNRAGKKLIGEGAEKAGKKAGKGSGGKGMPPKGKFKVTQELTAEEVNNWWKKEKFYDKPPYKPGTTVTEIELTENTKFVRVYDGKTTLKHGGWAMKPEDVVGLTPEQLKSKFALPSTPKYICDVEIPAGTRLRTGIANQVDGWGVGGGTQYDLIGQMVGEFYNERLLP